MKNTPLHAAGRALPAALTSRRALLAGLAIAPAAIGATVALPAAASSPAVSTLMPDPIFEVLARRQKAKDAFEAASAAAAVAEEKIEEMEKATRRAVQVGEELRIEDGEVVSRKPCFAKTRKELERHMGSVREYERDPVSLIKGGRKITPAWVAAPNIRELRAMLSRPDAATSGLRKAADRAEKRAERLCDEFSAATWSVYRTVPTSNAGLLALIEVCKEEFEDLRPEQEEIEVLLGTLEAFAKGRTLVA